MAIWRLCDGFSVSLNIFQYPHEILILWISLLGKRLKKDNGCIFRVNGQIIADKAAFEQASGKPVKYSMAKYASNQNSKKERHDRLRSGTSPPASIRYCIPFFPVMI